jgi:hypothetical protein
MTYPQENLVNNSLTYEQVLSLTVSISISITTVPSISRSWHGVEFLPHTLQAW